MCFTNLKGLLFAGKYCADKASGALNIRKGLSVTVNLYKIQT